MTGWVLIAGAASGIGRQTALELHGIGYGLILADVNHDGLEQLKSAIPDALIITADLTRVADAAKIADFISQKELILNGAVVTVGKAITMPVRNMDTDSYTDIFTTNVYSFQTLVRELLKAEIFCRESASVVVVSSITGEVGAKGKTAYGASKSALNALVRTMAVELASQNIRVNAVSPGTIQSEMLDRLENTIGRENVELLKQSFPLGIGSPGDVSGLIVFLISPMSRWMTGTVLTVDGGYSAK